MGFKALFLLTARRQVRYLLEWTEEDLDEAEDAFRAVDLEFCHPLCQCPKCAPAQKVWLFLCWGMGVEGKFFFFPLGKLSASQPANGRVAGCRCPLRYSLR